MSTPTPGPTQPQEQSSSGFAKWIALGFVAIILYLVVTGEAKITTNEGCQDWLDEVAEKDFNEGFNPPDRADWYGLGIGICFLDQTDVPI